MPSPRIIQQRVVNQQLIDSRFATAHDLIAWMGAIQAQEYAMARWAIGLRVPGLTNSAIEEAFNRGEILRTHVLRPTWHFVTPEDIRWMLALTAPRINSLNAYMHRQVGLDEKIFKRSNAILAKSLESGRHLTRTELQERLRQKKIAADGHRLSYIMMRAEIEGIICSGPRQGKQFTYALMEHRVKHVKAVSREEALIRLAERYFRSRGPATVHDFANWSGLSLKESRVGAASLSSKFSREQFLGKDHFFAGDTPRFSGTLPTFLMPEYDEYGMSYKDLGALWTVRPVSTDHASKPRRRYCLVIEGRLSGWWQKDAGNQTAIAEPAFLRSLIPSQRRAVNRAVEKYNRFIASSDP